MTPQTQSPRLGQDKSREEGIEEMERAGTCLNTNTHTQIHTDIHTHLDSHCLIHALYILTQMASTHIHTLTCTFTNIKYLPPSKALPYRIDCILFLKSKVTQTRLRGAYFITFYKWNDKLMWNVKGTMSTGYFPHPLPPHRFR